MKHSGKKSGGRRGGGGLKSKMLKAARTGAGPTGQRMSINESGRKKSKLGTM